MTEARNEAPASTDERTHDVVVIGAGPIGIELCVALTRAGVDHVHLEAKQVGHTISWWPRETEFFSTSERIAIAGVPIQHPRQGRITGEEYLAYLRSVIEQFDLDINSYEPVTDIERDDDGRFTLRTAPAAGARSYRAQRVVLAVGNMDRPNTIGVPGEELPHVTHYFTDPHRYFRTRLLVVGGKNSAVEAALRCWRAGADVAISYRRARFDGDRVKGHLLPDLEAQIETGTIGFLPETVPIEIRPGAVTLAPTVGGEPQDGPLVEHATDFVLLATGFRADMTLFEQAGVRLHGARQVPEFDEATMETNVPGLYVAGTAAAGTQSRYTLFIENTHVHVARIVEHITGQRPVVGTIAARDYDLPLVKIQAN